MWKGLFFSDSFLFSDTNQMTKKIKKLEKETTLWRTKWETNNQTLLQMAEEVRGIIEQLFLKQASFHISIQGRTVRNLY